MNESTGLNASTSRLRIECEPKTIAVGVKGKRCSGSCYSTFRDWRLCERYLAISPRIHTQQIQNSTPEAHSDSVRLCWFVDPFKRYWISVVFSSNASNWMKWVLQDSVSREVKKWKIKCKVKFGNNNNNNQKDTERKTRSVETKTENNKYSKKRSYTLQFKLKTSANTKKNKVKRKRFQNTLPLFLVLVDSTARINWITQLKLYFNRTLIVVDLQRIHVSWMKRKYQIKWKVEIIKTFVIFSHSIQFFFSSASTLCRCRARCEKWTENLISLFFSSFDYFSFASLWLSQLSKVSQCRTIEVTVCIHGNKNKWPFFEATETVLLTSNVQRTRHAHKSNQKSNFATTYFEQLLLTHSL